MDIRPVRPSTSLMPLGDLPRRDASEERRIFAASFKTGTFADPPTKRALVLGGDLLTKKHVRLIDDLRREGARLSFDNQALRDKSLMFEKRYRIAKLDLAHTREQLNLVQARYGKMQAELESSQKFMRKLDALFSGEKTQKLARALSLPENEIESARLLESQGETPRFEFHNPFGVPESP